MAITVVAPPDEIITREVAKKHLREDGSDQDDIIDLLITAVRQQIDAPKGWLGLALGYQTLQLTLDKFPCGDIRMPFPPLRNVNSVKYDDADGVEQTLEEGADYTVDLLSQPGWIIPGTAGWPATNTTLNAVNSVRIEFDCGHDDDMPLPKTITAWMLLNIGSYYANRETLVVGATVTPLPDHILNMLSTFRVY
jgi:uncharacterized phiE125 gp8 family phage protein